MRRAAGTPDRREPGRTAGFSILVVCTGNICRSPYVAAELALAHPEVQVSSAGTGAVKGSRPHPLIVEALERSGTPWSGTGRQLTRRIVAQADLILTMTGAQRMDVLHLARGRADSVLALKELAHAAGSFESTDTGTAAWTALVRHAQDVASGPSAMPDPDLGDPYGRPPEAFRRMMSDADAALSAIRRALTPSGDGARS